MIFTDTYHRKRSHQWRLRQVSVAFDWRDGRHRREPLKTVLCVGIACRPEESSGDEIYVLESGADVFLSLGGTASVVVQPILCNAEVTVNISIIPMLLGIRIMFISLNIPASAIVKEAKRRKS